MGSKRWTSAAAGNRPESTIRRRRHDGESVTLEISDDGRGMDAAAIARRGGAAGIDTPEGDLDAGALLEVICAPGPPPATKLTASAAAAWGRPCPRDVHDLGGTLTSRPPSAGDDVRRRAAADARDHRRAHRARRRSDVRRPQGTVHEAAEVDAGAAGDRKNELMTHRGVAVPVIRLSRLLR